MSRTSSAAFLICAAACGLAGGCTSAPPEMEVRAVKSSSDRIKGGANALAEAQSLLNLGNPGLALEAFRKIQRDNPSAEVLTGIAACYAAMGRDDLAQANLERALAFAPRSPQLLQSVAVVMDRQGLAEEANLARVEASELASAPPVASPVVDLPPDETEIKIASNEASTPTAAPDTVAPLAPARQVSVDQAIAAARRQVALLRLSSSVTVKLPPARPVAEAAPSSAPRLERLSPGEVALVTTAKPYWAPVNLRQSRTAAADDRWTPLKDANSSPNIRLLNAARIQGLAGAARAGLMDRGWRRIEVGDNPAIVAKSVVYYPVEKQRIGRSLAAHFGIVAVRRDGSGVTVLLGRDIASQVRG